MSLVSVTKHFYIFLLSALIWDSLSNNMPMNDLELTETIPISAFKSFYPVKGPYHGSKKTSDGKLHQFEKVDKTQYKKQANCVCFLTNESCIHAWIKALHEDVYLKYRDNMFNVIWRDHVADFGVIIGTEFLLNDNSQSEGKFMYKSLFMLPKAT